MTNPSTYDDIRFLALMLLIVTTGCGGASTANVAGIVTLDGSPLSTGTVTFYPAGNGRPAYGTIGEKGGYSVHVAGQSGLPPGSYQVAVAANAPTTVATQFELPAPGASLIPTHYGNVRTSGLNCQVTEGEQVYDIALTAASPAHQP